MVLLLIKPGVNTETMFASVDARTYLDTGKYYLEGYESPFAEIRPFMYSCIVYLTYTLGGTSLLWFFQFIFWLGTVILTWKTVLYLTKKKTIAAISVALILVNFSFAALTLHAITEVITAFILSLAAYQITRNVHSLKSPGIAIQLIFLLVLLTVIKPVFEVPLYFVLLIIFPAFWARRVLKTRKYTLLFCMALVPLIFQISVIKTQFQTFRVSRISNNTFTEYLFAQGIERNEKISREDAVAKAYAMSPEEKSEYFRKNIPDYLALLTGNIKGNITGIPLFLHYPFQYKKNSVTLYMEAVNKTVLIFHYFAIILLIINSVILIKNKNYPHLVLILTLSGLILYYLTTSGISFWQGDRLVISVLPVWAILYPVMGWLLYSVIKPVPSVKQPG
jgi:4-amino-4-deoxy-L-arabinose transferase-like glycosyltransferase